MLIGSILIELNVCDKDALLLLVSALVINEFYGQITFAENFKETASIAKLCQ